MFCIKCGNQLSDSDKFCIKCGYKVQSSEFDEVPQMQIDENMQSARAALDRDAQAAKEKREAEVQAAKEKLEAEARAKKEQASEMLNKGKKTLSDWIEKIKDEFVSKVKQYISENKKTCQVAAGVVAVLVVALFLYSQRKLTIDLNEFVTVEAQGYSKLADAVVTIDEERFHEVYGEKIKKHTDMEAYQVIGSCEFFKYELSKEHSISNGDVITLTWKNDAERALKDYKIRLKNENIEIEVAGLEESNEVNVFDYIDLVATGVNGAGTASLSFKENAPSFIKEFYYYIEQEYELSNGDEVLVQIDVVPGSFTDLPEGVILATLEHTYVVSGLGEYVNNIEQISDEIIYVAMDDAQSSFVEDIKNGKFGWNDEVAIKGMNCVGHFLTTSVVEFGTIENCLGLIYEVDVRLMQDGQKEDFTYYYPVFYKNLTVDENGNNSIEFTTRSMMDHSFKRGISGKNQWIFSGYESLDQLLESAYQNPGEYWGELMEPSGYVEKNHSEVNKIEADPHYLVTSELITEDAMKNMFEDAKESFITTTESWSDAVSVKEIKGKGVVFASNIYSDGLVNFLKILLEVKVELNANDMQEDFVYYAMIPYESCFVVDGKSVEAYQYEIEVEGPNFKKILGDEEIWEAWAVGPSNAWMFTGFQTIEEVKEYAEWITKDNLLYQGEVIVY